MNFKTTKRTKNTKGFNLGYLFVIFEPFVVNFNWFTAKETMIK